MVIIRVICSKIYLITLSVMSKLWLAKIMGVAVVFVNCAVYRADERVNCDE